jgi:hypothetical protein
MAAIKIDLRDLTLDNIHLWPRLIKKTALAVICLVIFIIGWLFDTRDLFHQLGTEKNNEIALQKELLIKQKKTININFHQAQIQTLKQTLTRIDTSKQRHKDPLESFPIAALQLIGILHKENIRVALITTPSHTVYQITKRGYIGQNNGRVIAITDDAIDILELIPNSEGVLEEKGISLKLLGN